MDSKWDDVCTVDYHTALRTRSLQLHTVIRTVSQSVLSKRSQTLLSVPFHLYQIQEQAKVTHDVRHKDYSCIWGTVTGSSVTRIWV